MLRQFSKHLVLADEDRAIQELPAGGLERLPVPLGETTEQQRPAALGEVGPATVQRAASMDGRWRELVGNRPDTIAED